jgi:hypothetical protein
MARKRTIKLDIVTIVLKANGEWQARENKKIIARNQDWILLIRTIKSIRPQIKLLKNETV